MLLFFLVFASAIAMWIIERLSGARSEGDGDQQDEESGGKAAGGKGAEEAAHGGSASLGILQARH